MSSLFRRVVAPAMRSTATSGAHSCGALPFAGGKAAWASSALSRQRRALSYATESKDLMKVKVQEFVMVEGEIARVISRRTFAMGRGAARGETTVNFSTGPKKGGTKLLQGRDLDYLPVNKAKLMFDRVDEDSNALVLRYYNALPDKTLEVRIKHKYITYFPSAAHTHTQRREETISLTAEAFEELIHGGEGCIHWLLPDMLLSALVVAEGDIIEMKMPPTHPFHIKNVLPLGGKYMILVEENEKQIEIDTASAKAGDRVTISLPKGRFVKMDKSA